MKLSIIVAVYESYGAVERQVKYWKSLDLPDDIEFILVDDGSNPKHEGYDLKNLRIHYTNDKRAWTQGLARNAGVSIAKGEYILCTDIDHILSKEAIMESYNFTGDKMIFPRFFAILEEDGSLTQDTDVLLDYGMSPDALTHTRGLYASYHGNTYTMKKSTFDLLGGNDEKACTYGHHATLRQGEDSYFIRKWNHWARKQDVKAVVGPRIFIFPIGRFHKDYDLNPKGLFHTLSYEPVPQPNKR